jgi:hypothetical protein
VAARWLRLYLPRFYLQRFPLLLGAFLLAYVPFALRVLPDMFRSTLVLSANGLSAVTAFTILAAVVVMATRRAVLLCGPQRFNIRWPATGDRLTAWTFTAHVSLAAPIVAIATWMSASEGGLGASTAILHAAAGAAGAAALLVLASAVHALITDESEQLPDVSLPSTAVLFRSVHGTRLPRTRAGAIARSAVRRLRPYLGPGYFNETGRLLPPHEYAVGIFFVFAVQYLGAYFVGHPQQQQDVPALAFVLILATLATIVLAGLAFLLDRHHLPTLLPIGLWMFGLAFVSASDHYFALRPAESALNPPMPYEIARTRERLLTIVAIDGGGIQAAGWGATVLTGIQRHWPDFHRSTRFISSVSGGSVGAMYYLAALRPDRPPRPEELDAVVEASTAGSLGEVGWGLAFPDLWRTIVPIVFYRFEKDRGWAMEQAWRRHLRSPTDTLSDWTDGVRGGWRPSMALNATGVESGQRFAFATFTPPKEWSLETVANRYPGYDIEVATAARLSATFPYVTPIAAALPGKDIKAWHYADGGYYDNTGMGMAMRWLDAAMTGHEDEFENNAVAFIRVRSSPLPAAPAPKERAWSYDSIGPIKTLLSVRTAGQRERSETELDFLKRLWCRRGVAIRAFEFAFELPIPGSPDRKKDPPLSWQLTPGEIRDLNEAWRSPANAQQLAAYLALKDAPVSGECTSGGTEIVRTP